MQSMGVLNFTRNRTILPNLANRLNRAINKVSWSKLRSRVMTRPAARHAIGLPVALCACCGRRERFARKRSNSRHEMSWSGNGISQIHMKDVVASLRRQLERLSRATAALGAAARTRLNASQRTSQQVQEMRNRYLDAEANSSKRGGQGAVPERSKLGHSGSKQRPGRDIRRKRRKRT